MQIIKPKKLQKGDTVAIVSPSGGVQDKSKEVDLLARNLKCV